MGVVIQNPLLDLDRLPLVVLAVPKEDLVASEEVSAAALMVEEVVGALEVVSKIVVGMVAAEVALDTKEVAVSPEVEEIVVGMEDLMATAHLPMLQLVQADVEAVVLVEAEVVMVAPALQIATVPAILPHLVGMIRVVVVAHMKTGTAAIAVVAEAMVIAINLEVLVAAIWSR